MAENQDVPPKAPTVEQFKVVGIVPGIVHWGNDNASPKIAWQDWDLRTISNAQKKLLFENGFPYLEKE